MAIELKTRRFTADEFHRMADAGILTEDDRVELIDGEIVEMTPIGIRHMWAVTFLASAFTRALGERAAVLTQQPLRLARDRELYPDVLLLRSPLKAYRHRLPVADDVLLLVEVSDTSLERDRGVKLARYGEGGVTEVWIVDLAGEAVESYRQPVSGRYVDLRRLTRGAELSPTEFPDVALAVEEILG